MAPWLEIAKIQVAPMASLGPIRVRVEAIAELHVFRFSQGNRGQLKLQVTRKSGQVNGLFVCMVQCPKTDAQGPVMIDVAIASPNGYQAAPVREPDPAILGAGSGPIDAAVALDTRQAVTLGKTIEVWRCCSGREKPAT